ADFSVVDYAGGVDDLTAGVLRLIGDPETRFREDPVRLLRAARFAAKLGFRIEPGAEEPMFRLGFLLEDIPVARLFDECLKLFMSGIGVEAYERLRHYDLFRYLFPETDASLAREEQDFPVTFVFDGLRNTDERLAAGKPVTPAFLFAVLLWEPVRQRQAGLMAAGTPPVPAMQQAAAEVIERQVRHVSIPKRFSIPMREIWGLQHRFGNRGGKRAERLMAHPRFRAAYDFLLLRASAGEADPELATWWTRYQEEDGAARGEMASKTAPGRRRRRRPRKRPAAQ
ncbi:MAG: polynucleotide adenylyltransferase PcnB, partial [Pseudomonadota bacterium]